MFNYAPAYVLRPLALSSIVMYYISLVVVLLSNRSLYTLLAGTNVHAADAFNREYAWRRFRTQGAEDMQ